MPIDTNPNSSRRRLLQWFNPEFVQAVVQPADGVVGDTFVTEPRRITGLPRVVDIVPTFGSINMIGGECDR